MTKEISAKFTSRCAACGSDIRTGEKITYDPAVKYSSRHKVCPTTVVDSKVPLNSPGRGALQGRGRGDFFLGEKSEIARTYAMDDKPNASDLGQTILSAKGAEAGKYLTVIGLAAHWVSQQEADDFDLIGTGGGGFSRHWSVTKYYRIATEEGAAPVIARAAERQKAVDRQAALDAWEKRITRCGDDLEPRYSNRIDTPREGLTTLRTWHTSTGAVRRSVSAVQLADGRIGYRFTDSYYDWPQDYVVIVGEFFAEEPPQEGK